MIHSYIHTQKHSVMRLSFHLQNWSKLCFPHGHYVCWAGLCRALHRTVSDQCDGGQESDKAAQDTDKDHRLVYVWDSSAITVVSSTQLALMRMCNPKTTSIWNCASRPVSVVKPVVTYARSSSTAITQRTHWSIHTRVTYSNIWPCIVCQQDVPTEYIRNLTGRASLG